MTDASKPRPARGKMLPAGILATALIALLAFAPLASAASDPLASGSTTITLNSNFTNYLKTFGITMSEDQPDQAQRCQGHVHGHRRLARSDHRPRQVNLGGGLKFKAGKKTAPVKALVLNTSNKSLTAKVGGKKMKLASIAGWSSTRNGFGVNLKINKAEADRSRRLGPEQEARLRQRHAEAVPRQQADRQGRELKPSPAR